MEWISVKKRLPKDDSFCLIAFDDKTIRFGNYWKDGNVGWHDTDGELYYGVTHWMPLPKPPKQ